MGSRDRFEVQENPPDPRATIESLRSLGYSMESALADLIDNSLAVKAKDVAVHMFWDANDSWCAVVDNGTGMSEDKLVQAMRVGSVDPLAARDEADLGRFGFGLNTASFSQARQMSVATRVRAGGALHVRCWDLDDVRDSGRWLMRKQAPPRIEEIQNRLLGRQRGTVVIWSRLSCVETSLEESGTDAAARDFVNLLSLVNRHLGMTFCRPIAAGVVKLTLNDRVVEPWDPFLTQHDSTQPLSEERLRLRGHLVTVRPFVLPHASRLSATEESEASGPDGWNDQQGFYVFRRDRLIAAGTWLGLKLGRSDQFNLARIAIDIPPELDHEWHLNINKTAVQPPQPLVKDLQRIAESTRKRAKRVQVGRGGRAATVGGRAHVQTLWSHTVRRGDSALRIDRNHPLVAFAFDEAGLKRRVLDDLLKLIEQTIPVAFLPTRPLAEDDAPLSGESFETVYELAERAYEFLLSTAGNRTDAIRKLKQLEPFDMYPDVVQALTERSEDEEH